MMKHVIAVMSILFLTACASTKPNYSDESPVPDGVRYFKAADSVNEIATTKLVLALTGQHIFIEDLVSEGVKRNGRVLLGTFLAQQLGSHSSFHPDSLEKGLLKLPLSKEDGIVSNFPFYLAVTQDQAVALSTLFSNAYASAPSPIMRKLTKEEMALIWFYIGWDIVEPIYVVEIEGRKVVFDFGPDGSYLEWIEDITEPCFKVTFQAGSLPCMCSVVVNQKNQYQVVFQQKEQCPKSGSIANNTLQLTTKTGAFAVAHFNAPPWVHSTHFMCSGRLR